MGYTLLLKFVRFINQAEEPAVAPMRARGAEQRNKRSHHTCSLCDKVIIGDLEWTGEAVYPRHSISDLLSDIWEYFHTGFTPKYSHSNHFLTEETKQCHLMLNIISNFVFCFFPLSCSSPEIQKASSSREEEEEV